MDDQRLASKWKQLARLITELALANGDQPITAVQVGNMTRSELLQDRVRAAIYYRGWNDRTADIQRTLEDKPGQSLPVSPSRPPQSPPSTSAATTSETSSASIGEPAQVPETSDTNLAPVLKKISRGRINKKEKFKKIKEKRKTKKALVSHQRWLAKRFALTSDPKANNQPPTTQTPIAAMEADPPSIEDTTPKEWAPSTSQEQLSQNADSVETRSVA